MITLLYQSEMAPPHLISLAYTTLHVLPDTLFDSMVSTIPKMDTPVAPPQAMMVEADKDFDGLVSPDEFYRIMKRSGAYYSGS